MAHKNFSKKSVFRVFLLIAVALLFISGASFLALKYYFTGKVPNGVSVYGVDFSGVNREIGYAMLEAIEADVVGTPVAVRCGSDSWVLLPHQVGLRIDKAAVMDNALVAANMSGLGSGGWGATGGSPVTSGLLATGGERGGGSPAGVLYADGAPVTSGVSATGGAPITSGLLATGGERGGGSPAGDPPANEVPLVFEVDDLALRKWVDDKTTSLCRSPIDAALDFNEDDTVKIIPSTDGLQVNVQLFQFDLYKALAYRSSPRAVALRFSRVAPQRTTEKLQAMGIKGLLSEFATEFDNSLTNRVYNIKVAAGALNGLMVAPGEEVSFNEIVGPRSTEAGYKSAKVIFNNAMVDGIGGGVCQVTSTLYNAVLLAGLAITERTPHSLPIGYVPAGRDATVVYQEIDLKFRNNGESYLYIRSLVDNGKITFKIYGDTALKKDIIINNEIIEVTEPKTVYVDDPNFDRGVEEVKQAGARGYKVKTERVFLNETGEAVLRESFPLSIYRPVDRIVAVGVRGVNLGEGPTDDVGGENGEAGDSDRGGTGAAGEGNDAGSGGAAGAVGDGAGATGVAGDGAGGAVGDGAGATGVAGDGAGAGAAGDGADAMPVSGVGEGDGAGVGTTGAAGDGAGAGATGDGADATPISDVGEGSDAGSGR